MICLIPTYSTGSDDITPVAVAGDWFPEVHFEGIGYALIADNLSAITVNPEWYINSNIYGSDQGGTTVTISGRNFGNSLEDSYNT